jgi:hypothetical protein
MRLLLSFLSRFRYDERDQRHESDCEGNVCKRPDAFGGKADITRAAPMSAFDPERTLQLLPLHGPAWDAQLA